MKKCLMVIVFIQFFILGLQAQQNEYWLNSGDLSLRQNNLQIALKNYNFHIENYPKDPTGYIHRARLYNLLGRDVEGKLDLKMAEQLNPLALMSFNPALRSKFSAKKSYDYKYDNLEKAFVKTPSSITNYKTLFENVALGHSQDSIIADVIDKLSELKIDEAERSLSRVSVTDLNLALIFDLQGKIALKRMNYKEAIKLFTKAIEVSPQFSIAYHNRSLCHKLLGDYDASEKDLLSAIDIDNDVSLFYFTYAKLNEKKGETETAIEYYSKALSVDPDYEEALVNYSQLLKGLGEFETGLSLLNEAIDKNPSSIENIFHKANLHFVYGDFEDAIADYNKFLIDQPNDSDALFNKGLSQILLRQNDVGCRELEKSLDIKNTEKRRYLYEMFCDSM